MLHELGSRAARSFMVINCGAIREAFQESDLLGCERGGLNGAAKQTIGRIETAHQDTPFLDEIGDLPHGLQIKLVRFLRAQAVERVGGRQPVPVDVRVVAATDQLVKQRIEVGSFGVGLFHQLDLVSVWVPPFRERGGDAVLLVHCFLNRVNREFGCNLRDFTASALSVLTSHLWPGNVRELENRVKRAVIMAQGRMIDNGD